MDEDKRGIYASSALAGALVVVSVMLLAAVGEWGLVGNISTELSEESSEESSGEERGSASSASEEAGTGGGSESYWSGEEPGPATAESTRGAARESGSGPGDEAPEDLSFVCDNFAAGGDAAVPSVEREELEAAAERYVLTAYGDPGADPAAYEDRVERLTVEECFSGSPAATYVENAEGTADRGGRQAAPVDTLDDTTFSREFVLFDPTFAQSAEDEQTGAVYTKVTGEAVWVSEESDGSGAVGKQQKLTLVKPEGGEGEWKVSSGQTIPAASYMDSEYQSELPPDVG